MATSTIAWLATEQALCSSAFVVVPPQSAPGSRASAAAIAESQSLAGLQSSSVNEDLAGGGTCAGVSRRRWPAFAWAASGCAFRRPPRPPRTTGGSLPSSTLRVRADSRFRQRP
jgi:hypothetical protein